MRFTPLPLRDNSATGPFLPWTVALGVFLAALAIAGALTLAAAVERWRADRAATLTIELPALAGDDGGRRIDKVLAVLTDTDGVAGARPLARAELVALLEPWLGAGNIDPGLPLPRLIDVRLTPSASVDLARLKTRLAVVAPGVAIDDRQLWLDRLVTVAHGFQAVALAVAIAAAATFVGAVVFTTRTQIAVHRETVEVLHLIGAEDGFVAAAFARRSLVSALWGGVLGLVPAMATLVALGEVIGAVEAPLLPRLTITPLLLAALAALPPLAGLLALITARTTAMSALARLP